MLPQAPSKEAPWDLTQFSQLPSAALLYFLESYQWSEISYLSKVILVLGKTRSRRAPNLGCRRAESPGWLHVSQKNSAQDMMHVWAPCDEAANLQLPIAAAFWTNWIVSAEERPRLMRNFKQICCTILASHFECNGHTLHMLTQWASTDSTY